MNEKIDNLRNEAYSLLLELKDKKLWESLEDGSFFAVNASGEEPSFVEVRTLEEDKPVLNVYWNGHDLGMTNLLNRNHYHRVPFSIYSSLTEQNLTQVAFDEKDYLVGKNMEHFGKFAQDKEIDISKWDRFPNIISFETGLYPRELDDEEKLETLVRCLNAAEEIAEKLESETAEELGFAPSNFYFPTAVPLLTETANGFNWETTPFPEKVPEEVITYEYDNDELSQKVKSLKKGLFIDAYFARLPVPVTMEGDGDEEAVPFYPMGLVVSRMHRGDYPENLFFGLAKDYTEEAMESLLDGLAERFLENGVKPEQINCYDDRTNALLKDFGKKTGIHVPDRRKAQNEEYTNLPVRLYNDVMATLKKFQPMPEEILTDEDPEAKKLYKQLKKLSNKDVRHLLAGKELEIDGIGKLNHEKYFILSKVYSVKPSTPKNRIDEIDDGIFPESYDQEGELRSFSRLKPPVVGALSYVLSISTGPGTYTHIQIDGDSTLEDLINYVNNRLNIFDDYGRIAMDNKLYTNALIYERYPYQDEEFEEEDLDEENPDDEVLEEETDEFFADFLKEDLLMYFNMEYYIPPTRLFRCYTDEITLKELDLQTNQKFKYLYVDDWERSSVQFKVLRAVPEATEGVKTLRDISSNKASGN